MVEDRLIELIEPVLREMGSVREAGESFAEPPLDVLVGLPLLPQPTRVAIPTAAMRATKGRACATRPYMRSCLSTFSCGDGKTRPSWARCADAISVFTSRTSGLTRGEITTWPQPQRGRCGALS